MKKIACVIVTYNRKDLLKRCLHAVASQSCKPACVYILDNASSDGTKEAVEEWGWYNVTKESVQYKYILNKNNGGGAGGFYRGMKYAMEDGYYDALWVMDDDGEPDKECLRNLCPHLANYDYIAPIVLSDIDHNTCSFVPDTTYQEFCKKSVNGIIKDWASPFNGILFSSRLIRKIGYPKKELFIWGDEINYQLRAVKAGFQPITMIDAIHYHPIDKQMRICTSATLNVVIILVEQRWKQYCAIRNRVYNLHFIYNKYVAFKKARELYQAYINYYHSIGDKSHDSLVIDAVISGYLGYWRNLKKYFNQ